MGAPRHRVAPAKLRIEFGSEIAMGPGKAALLEAIRYRELESAARAALEAPVASFAELLAQAPSKRP